MSRLEHVVVWNGARTGPGGAYLFAEDQPTLDAPLRGTPRKESPLTARVVSILLAAPEPMTRRELAATLDVASHDLNTAMYQLRTKRLIDVVGYRPLDGSPFGRTVEQLYALIDGGDQ